MELFVVIVFLLVYVGMFLGEIPGLMLDRTGVALLGAIALVAGGARRRGAPDTPSYVIGQRRTLNYLAMMELCLMAGKLRATGSL